MRKRQIERIKKTERQRNRDIEDTERQREIEIQRDGEKDKEKYTERERDKARKRKENQGECVCVACFTFYIFGNDPSITFKAIPYILLLSLMINTTPIPSSLRIQIIIISKYSFFINQRRHVNCLLLRRLIKSTHPTFTYKMVYLSLEVCIISQQFNINNQC